MNESNTCGNHKRNELIIISDSINTKRHSAVMTEYLGLLSRQKLVHGMVVITVGGTRRDVCLCKEGFEGGEAGREGAPRWAAHMSRGGVSGVLIWWETCCLSCVWESRDSLSCNIDPVSKGYSWRTLATFFPSFQKLFRLLLPHCTHIH